MQGMTRLICAAAICLAAQAFGLISLDGDAVAVPTVSFKALFVPIQGSPKTGNILGAGAALQTEYTFSGTEYAGRVPPLLGLNLYLPSKTKLHVAGFVTCSPATLESSGIAGCPKGSLAGSVGSAIAFVAFGPESVEESLEVDPVYEPGGGLGFWIQGYSPTTLEFLAPGSFLNARGGGGFGPDLDAAFALRETFPGAPYVSFRSIRVKFGTSYSAGKKAKPVFLLTVPKKCPAGGFKLKSEATFAENGEESRPVTATSEYRAPCPK